MSSNRQTHLTQMNAAASDLLREKGYISFVDILIRMGMLTKEDYEEWRFRKVPCLEGVIKVNLARINFLLRGFHKNAGNGGLRPSRTVYNSWGKGPKRPLRFSKGGEPNIEEAYATHYMKPTRAAALQSQPEKTEET